jgi:hypothetical protein
MSIALEFRIGRASCGSHAQEFGVRVGKLSHLGFVLAQIANAVHG